MGPEGLELHSVLEGSRDCVLLVELDGRISFISRVLRGTVEDVIGTYIQDWAQPEERERVWAGFEQVRATGRPGWVSGTHVNAQGQRSLWETRVSAITRQGCVTGFVATASDVTERRETQADRDRVFALSGDAIAVWSEEGLLRRANPALEQVLGRSSDELVGRSLLDFVHSADRRAVRVALSGLGQSSTVDFECRFVLDGGDERLVAWRASWDPRTRLVYGVGRDVTQARELEQQLRQSQKMNAVGLLASGVAHDFNNMLVAIMGNAELGLRQLPAEHAAAGCMRAIAEAADRASSLTRQLLNVSRPRRPRFERLDLHTVVWELSGLLERALPENIEMRTELEGEAPVVKGDLAQLEQVLMNLCVNDRDAMPRGGVLTVGAQRQGAQVRVWVRDTGEGMPPEVADRVFEPFFSTKEGTGHGLGLATVYGIVRQHRGRVQVRSTPGRGTTFTVLLPLVRGQVQTPRESELPPPGWGRVLVAEDDGAARSVAERVLRGAGYEVVTARDGDEALEWLGVLDGDVRLVLLDVVMPRLGGLQAYAALREHWPGTPVLFVSGHADSTELPLQDDGKPAPLLHKPYRAVELLRAVDAVLHRLPA